MDGVSAVATADVAAVSKPPKRIELCADQLGMCTHSLAFALHNNTEEGRSKTVREILRELDSGIIPPFVRDYLHRRGVALLF